MKKIMQECLVLYVSWNIDITYQCWSFKVVSIADVEIHCIKLYDNDRKSIFLNQQPKFKLELDVSEHYTPEGWAVDKYVVKN